MMSILQSISNVYTSAARFWYGPSAGSHDGTVDYLTGYASGSSFNDDHLSYDQFDSANDQLFGPVDLGRHLVPGTDQNTGVGFDNSYAELHLSDSLNGAIFTTPASADFDSNDRTSLKFETLDNSGNVVHGPMSLQLGNQSSVQDLYSVGETGLPDYGRSFVVAYSTFDPQSGNASIDFTRFNDSGKALNSGTLQSFDDGSHHGLDFTTNYASDNPLNGGNPDYILINRVAGGNSGVQVALYDTSMQQTESTFVPVTGPDGERPTSIDKYNYAGPGTTAKTNFGVLSETFQYEDSSGTTHEEIELEKINPTTLQVEAKTRFADVDGTASGVGLQHLSNGDTLAIYNDGGQSYIKEFNQSLKQVGNAYALPSDNYGWDNFVPLGNDQFKVSWREEVGSGAGLTVKHAALFQA